MSNRLSRRVALAAAVVPWVSGCTGSRGTASASSAASGAATVQLRTAVGTIELRGSDLEAWKPLVLGAAERVAGVWGGRERTTKLTFCSTDEEFEEASAGLGDLTAAVTTPDGIVVGPSVPRTLTVEGREVVLAHELTHAVLGHFGSDRTALWVKEGAAEWTAERGVSLAPRALWPTIAAQPAQQRPSGPPAASEFQTDASRAYETAAAYATYLVSVWGQPRFCAMVRKRPDEPAAAELTRSVRQAAHPTFSAWLNARLAG